MSGRPPPRLRRLRLRADKLPTLTLGRRLVLAFGALVTVAVIVTGAAFYTTTVHSLNVEVDRSLASAAATVAAGGTVLVSGLDTNANDRHDIGGIVSSVRRINADGSVTHVLGASVAWPITAADRALLTATTGTGRYDTFAVDETDWRVYTLAQGPAVGAIQVARDLDETDRVVDRLALQTALIGLAVILLAVAAGWWIARRTTRRLVILARAAQHVTATGDLATPLNTTGRDEIGQLGASLEGMLGQLAAAREAQQRLVENAGHELRTPLTSLRANARVLRRVAELPSAHRDDLLDDVDSELLELTTLVNELVDLATDRRNAEPVGTVDLRALADRVADRARRRSGREITVTGDGIVVGRAHALTRALTNLVDNAVKFDAHPDHRIDIRVGVDGVAVADRGPGVPQEDRERIFDRFYRADTARSLPGSGLGLAIVRDVAEQHGGTAYVRPGPETGAVIGFSIGAHA